MERDSSSFIQKRLLFEILSLALLIAILHKIALMYSLYWITDWADMIMHTLGGLLIGLLALFIFFTSGYIQIPKNTRVVILITLGSVLIVGLSWELWEIWFGLIDALADKIDSMTDLFFDLVGGTLALIYFYFKKSK